MLEHTRAASALLAAALALVPAVSDACLHGATGREQTSIVDGASRVDRLYIAAGSGRFVKLFVADPGAKVTGASLSGELKAVHAQLGTAAAEIASEGTRGGSELSFGAAGVSGKHIALDEKNFPDWAAVARAAGLPPRSDGLNEEWNALMTRWLSAVRAAGRAAHLVTVDAPAGSGELTLAMKISYGGSGVERRVVADKMFETASSDPPVPSITWFMGRSAAQVGDAIRQAGAGAGEGEGDFAYSLPDVGAADVRVRERELALNGVAKKVSGLVWMQ